MVDSGTNYVKGISTLLRDTNGAKLKVFAMDISHFVRAAEISAESKRIFQSCTHFPITSLRFVTMTA